MDLEKVLSDLNQLRRDTLERPHSPHYERFLLKRLEWISNEADDFARELRTRIRRSAPRPKPKSPNEDYTPGDPIQEP